jgi:hypothetical protein
MSLNLICDVQITYHNINYKEKTEVIIRSHYLATLFQRKSFVGPNKNISVKNEKTIWKAGLRGVSKFWGD